MRYRRPRRIGYLALGDQVDQLLKNRKVLLDELKSLSGNEYAERRKVVEDIIKNDGVEKLNDEMWALATDFTTTNKIQLLFTTLQRTKWLDTFRFWVEVAFPSLLAIAALGVGIAWLTHHQ